MNNLSVKLSIIIPVLNEEEMLDKLLPELVTRCPKEHLSEIIVADGGSKDNTGKVADVYNALYLDCPKKGRSVQMNFGARHARGDVLYFVHADTLPPENFSSNIFVAVNNGYKAGCFMSKFDIPHWFLRIGNYLSFLPFWFCRGGGQTLFITKKFFNSIGGYNEDMRLMEEYDLIKKIRQHTRFKVIRRFAITSARDYVKYGPFRLQFIYIRVFRMYARGSAQDDMIRFVNNALNKIKH